MTTIIATTGGVATVLTGTAHIIDMDNYNVDGVAEKGQAIADLLLYMDDRSMLDTDAARESVHKKLDALMDTLTTLAITPAAMPEGG